MAQNIKQPLIKKMKMLFLPGNILMLINKHRDTVLQLTFVSKAQWFSVWPCRCKCLINVRWLSRHWCGNRTNNIMQNRTNKYRYYDLWCARFEASQYNLYFSLNAPIPRQVSIAIKYGINVHLALKSSLNVLCLKLIAKLKYLSFS